MSQTGNGESGEVMFLKQSASFYQTLAGRSLNRTLETARNQLQQSKTEFKSKESELGKLLHECERITRLKNAAEKKLTRDLAQLQLLTERTERYETERRESEKEIETLKSKIATAAEKAKSIEKRIEKTNSAIKEQLEQQREIAEATKLVSNASEGAKNHTKLAARKKRTQDVEVEKLKRNALHSEQRLSELNEKITNETLTKEERSKELQRLQEQLTNRLDILQPGKQKLRLKLADEHLPNFESIAAEQRIRSAILQKESKLLCTLSDLETHQMALQLRNKRLLKEKRELAEKTKELEKTEAKKAEGSQQIVRLEKRNFTEIEVGMLSNLVNEAEAEAKMMKEKLDFKEKDYEKQELELEKLKTELETKESETRQFRSSQVSQMNRADRTKQRDEEEKLLLNRKKNELAARKKQIAHLSKELEKSIQKREKSLEASIANPRSQTTVADQVGKNGPKPTQIAEPDEASSLLD